MALPEPTPGLVIRYDYLWNADAKAGRLQGKDCLVVATDPSAAPRFVVILPITHVRPSRGAVGVEIPPRVRAAIGLDDERCWVIVSEYNVDEWPNPGLRALPGHPRKFSYGFLPPRMFADIKAKFLEIARSGESLRTKR